jgi:DNA-binding MarR family transcriptional regulator
VSDTETGARKASADQGGPARDASPGGPAGDASRGDDAGLRAWRAMLLAHAAALRAIEADLDRARCIPLTWYDVLLELNAAPDGRLRMHDLADRVVLSRTRVSRLADEMAVAGLVTKTRHQTDGRVVWGAITEAGHQALRATAPHYLRGIEEHFSRHLTEQEQEVVATALTKVRDARNEITITG